MVELEFHFTVTWNVHSACLLFIKFKNDKKKNRTKPTTSKPPITDCKCQ